MLVLVLVLVELLVLVDVELEVEVEVELLVVVVRLPSVLHASLQATWARTSSALDSSVGIGGHASKHGFCLQSISWAVPRMHP